MSARSHSGRAASRFSLAMSLRLSNQTLRLLPTNVARPTYDRAATKIGVAHIGPGAFHRAHQAVFLDDLLRHDSAWGISAIALQSTRARDALGPQDGFFSLTTLGGSSSIRVIGSIKEVIAAQLERERALNRLANQSTLVITVTVTEKGYCLNAQGDLDISNPGVRSDLERARAPQSLVGTLVESLRRRKANGLRAPVIVSCDNLASNGRLLARAVCQFAGEIDAELARWIANEVRFPSTMVDCITPAADEAFLARVHKSLGLQDRGAVQREEFAQWVIEDSLGEWSAQWGGAGVTLVKDVAPFEQAKLRLLNGAHSALAYIGLLRGFETVAAAMADPPLANFIARLLREDIAPTVAGSEIELESYIAMIERRFRSPEIDHKLAQIAWDGSQKLPIRILSTVQEALRARQPIARLSIAIAAWMHFIRNAARSGAAIVDPFEAKLREIGQRCNGDEDDVEHFISLKSVFSELTFEARFISSLKVAYSVLAAPGRPHASIDFAEIDHRLGEGA